MKKENLIINKKDYNSFDDFNIEKIETLASFREKYTNQKIMLMHNGRILSVNNGFYSIYDLESNTSSEIFQRGNIKDSIILTKQGDIIISEESNVNVVKCGEYYNDLWQNLLNLAKGQYLEFYNTSSIFYYSFYFQKLIYIKRDKINLQKREINEIYDIDCDQIAIRASVNDTENQKLYFYDLNKNKEITSIKLNDDNTFEICVVSENISALVQITPPCFYKHYFIQDFVFHKTPPLKLNKALQMQMLHLRFLSRLCLLSSSSSRAPGNPFVHASV
jgi:hypothetical protein